MPSEIVEKFLLSFSQAAVSDAFIFLVVGVFVFASYEAIRMKHSRFLDHAPAVMTSLGILGTFGGIVIGLLHFDPEEMDRSIQLLLGGIKIAFISSLVGMSAAIVFKVADSYLFAPKRALIGVRGEITPRDIHQELVSGNERLEMLRKSLSDSEEGTLVGQLKLLRADMNEANRRNEREREVFAEKLWSEMQNFSDLLARSATEAVVDALRKVIEEFNKNLVKQFGDNFKRLDESVKKLVVWQEQYMQQLDQMSEQYAEGVNAIDETRAAVVDIATHTAEIPVHLKHLRRVLEVNQHQLQELERHLEAFVLMRDKAVEATPLIQAQLDEVARQMTASADSMRTTLLEGAQDFSEGVARTSAGLRELATNMVSQAEGISDILKASSTQLSSSSLETVGRLEQGVKSMQDNMNDSVAYALGEMRKSLEKTLSGLEAEVARSINRTGEGISRQLDALDTALAQELEGAMRKLGTGLASITSQFASDYERLVSAMQKVVMRQVG